MTHRLAIVGALLLACTPAPRVHPSLLGGMGMTQARCRQTPSQSSLLVTEWPASEKANLEAMLPRGGVAVALNGCNMAVVPQCPIGGRYAFQRTTPAADTVDIATADELWAKLPLGAANLEAELQRSHRLSVQTTVTGQYRLEAGEQIALPATPDCGRATHILGSISVGAFALTRSGAAAVGGQAGVGAIGAGGKLSESATLVRAAGDPQSCLATTDAGPDPNCASPIQVFLWPIPGRVAEVGPPGTIRTELVSTSADQRWDVFVDDRAVCSTPCSLWLEADRPLILKDRLTHKTLTLADGLGEVAVQAGAVQVRAHGRSDGWFTNGVVFTSLGGMGVAAGVALASIGCIAGQGDGLCTAGVITLVPSAILTAASIWMIRKGMPYIELAPTGGVSF